MNLGGTHRKPICPVFRASGTLNLLLHRLLHPKLLSCTPSPFLSLKSSGIKILRKYSYQTLWTYSAHLSLLFLEHQASSTLERMYRHTSVYIYICVLSLILIGRLTLLSCASFFMYFSLVPPSFPTLTYCLTLSCLLFLSVYSTQLLALLPDSFPLLGRPP